MATNVSRMVVQFLADTTQMQAQMKVMEKGVASFGTNLQKNMAYSNNAMSTMGSNLKSIGSTMSLMGASMTRYISMPLAALGIVAIKTGIDFETAFAGVKKTIDATDEEYAQMAKDVQDIAVRTGVNVKDVAATMQMAGQMGIRGAGNLATFTETVSKLTISTGMAAGPLSMMLGKFVAITGLDVGTEMTHIGDVITELGNKSATTESAILKFGVRIAAVGRLSGMSEADMLALAAAAEASGTKAERGGTALTKILLKMRQEAIGAASANKEYSASVTDNEGKIKSLNATLADLLEEQKNLGANATSAEMQGLSDKIVTTQEAIANLTEENEHFNTSIKDTGKEAVSFASFLGITNDKFKEIYFGANGASEVFGMFLDRVGEGNVNLEDVTGIMAELGLSDTRLVQTVLSLAAANDKATQSFSSYDNAISNARAAFAEATGDYSGALDREVAKRLDTVTGQFGILKEVLKAIATVFTSDTNAGIKEFLKTINLALISVLEWLRGLDDKQMKLLVNSLVGLIALGPGLAIFGKTFGALGAAFETVGTSMSLFKMGAKGILNSVDENTLMPWEIAANHAENKRLKSQGSYKMGSLFKKGNIKEAMAKKWASMTGGAEHDLMMSEIDRANATPDGFSKDKNGRWRDKKTGKFTSSATIDKARASAPKSLMDKLTDGKNNSIMKVDKALGGISGKFKALQGMTPKWLNGLFAGFGQVFNVVKGVAFALGGWAIVIAVIASALTLFFMATGKGANDVKKIFFNLNNQIWELFAKLFAFLDNLVKELPAFFVKFGSIFTEVLTGMENIGVSLIQMFWMLLPKLFEILAQIIGSLVDVFITNLPQILDMLINFVLTFFKGFMDNLPGILNSIFSIIESLVRGFFEALPSLFVAAVKLLWGALELLFNADWGKILSSILEGLGSIIWGAIEGFANGLYAALPGMFEWLYNDLPKIIMGALNSAGTWLYNAGVSILTGLWNGIYWYFSTAFSVYFNVGKWIMDAVVGVGTWLYNAGKSVLTGMWNGLWWYWSTVFSTAFNIAKWIKDSFVGAGTWLYSIGSDIIQGLLNGLSNMGAAIGSFFLNLLPDWIRGPFKLALGIRSPSKVFAGYGRNIGQGLIDGMAGMEGDVMKASDAIAQATMIDPSALNQAMNIQGGTVTHDYSGITGALVAALESVGLKVFMNGKDVTDIVNTELALAGRRG